MDHRAGGDQGGGVVVNGFVISTVMSASAPNAHREGADKGGRLAGWRPLPGVGSEVRLS